jgi:hypothetical protein
MFDVCPGVKDMICSRCLHDRVGNLMRETPRLVDSPLRAERRVPADVL